MEPHDNLRLPAIPPEPTNEPGPSGSDSAPSRSTLSPPSGTGTIVEAHTGAIKKQKEDKKTKRDQRSWDNMLKTMCHLSNTEKLEVIKNKYTNLYVESRTSHSSLKTAEKQLKFIQREKEHMQSELTKHILAKSKLECLARELQKQNKDIKEENFNRLKEEEEKRKEVAANLTEKLNTLTQLMDENKDKSMRLRDENINMTSKLTELYDQFQERETHLASMNRQMELQKKIFETQQKKLELEFEAQHEIWKKEKAMLVANLEKSDETNKILQENVNSLQDHLNSYQKQYVDFEATMKKSNRVFDSFREEMVNMHKANNILEQDRDDWHSRWKAITEKCLGLNESKTKTLEDLQLTQKKLDALEKLCRKLTAERSYYLQQLKLCNITPITPVDEESE